MPFGSAKGRLRKNGDWASNTSLQIGERGHLFGSETISGEIGHVIADTSRRSSLYLSELSQSTDECRQLIVQDLDQNLKSVRITEMTTVADLCRFVQPHVDLRNCQLMLEVQDLAGFAHPIEDHENIIHVIRSFASPSSKLEYRLVLREHLNKYSMITDNEMLHSETQSPFEDTNALLFETTSLFNQSMTNMSRTHLPGGTVPSSVTSGTIWVRTPEQPWKQRFCFLHGSAVFYSTKRTTKVSARHMKILVDLSISDVFHWISSNEKLEIKSPTREVLVCRPSGCQQISMKSLTYFACRTRAGLLAWENGFRVHKYGMIRLESNWQRANISEGEHRGHRTVSERKLRHSQFDHYQLPSVNEDEISTFL